ncbi:LRR receptor-like serine/threonine-protein kinase EFR [Dichanthelium oligosanthes]|uniref:non-specific serine/threonine protein kinase n=1 Tax=Dichanthelium oligosanthes TaxID=888268 RepID=A0A1E5WI00_9POAL|nr:LRR receptor-like serine/threonine-protein kinase EFR [Dichanthelium oligosanthes]
MKATATGRFLLVLMACSVHAVTCRTAPKDQTDRLSLLEFKKAISFDPQQALASWNDSTHFCNWEGVMCRTTRHRVTNLALENRGSDCNFNNIEGNIPDEFAKLPGLLVLQISSNQLAGSFPQAILNLSTLGALGITMNHLSGEVPPDLDLSIFDMSNNNFAGVVPRSIGKLRKLYRLNLEVLLLGHNQLSSGFPSGIANLHNLMELGLRGNQFTGEVPEWVGTLKSLQVMNLENNSFTGIIPSPLSNLSQLSYLYLDSNKLEGNLPASIGNLQNLQVCNFSNNLLHGGIPKEMFGIPTLTIIDLSVNNLLGQLPYEVGNAKALIYFSLSSNMPFGDIPNTIGNISSLQALNLSHNNLTGSIPMSLGNLQYLEQLDLSFNNISGNVPKKGIFRNVTAVWIDGNPGLCGGPSELHLLAYHVLPVNPSKQKHSIVQKVVIPLSGIVALAIVITVMVVWWRGRCDGNTSTRSHITMVQRLSIVVDVADALEYLHHSNQGTIVHCDLKPSNILLDDNMTAHVGDFGLARFKFDLAASSFADSISSSVAIKGTIGYIAPECAVGGAVSSAGDVYNFGIVLLEIFLRRRPTDDMFNGGLNITKFVEMNFPDMIPRIIDPELLEEHQDLSQETSLAMKEKSLECLLSVLNIGLLCTKPSPNERICMQEVAARLHEIKKAYPSGS